MIAVLAADPVSSVLIGALVVLAGSLVAIAASRSGNAGGRSTVQVARPAPVRAIAVPVPRPMPATIELSGPVSSGPPGQTARPPDLLPGERITIETASALAEHFADTDPARIVEVISYWMQEDSDEPGWNRSS